MRTAMKPIVFDAYGTLLDVHSAVRRHADAIGAHAERLSELWRTKQLEYTWIHAARGGRATFRELTEEALDYAAARTGGLGSARRADLLAAYERLSPYREVQTVLSALKSKGHPLAILSNGDPDQLATAVTAAGIDRLLDAVISIAEAGPFKPHPSVYALATTRFAATPAEVMFVSSNRWDVAGAKSFGFTTVWVNRGGLPDEYPGLPADRVLADLNPLAG
jgi:2-haloacid dehalogenase